MSLVIKKCSCNSKFQDKTYGPGMRVMNLNNKKGAKCSVCGTIHKVD